VTFRENSDNTKYEKNKVKGTLIINCARSINSTRATFTFFLSTLSNDSAPTPFQTCFDTGSGTNSCQTYAECEKRNVRDIARDNRSRSGHDTPRSTLRKRSHSSTRSARNVITSSPYPGSCKSLGSRSFSPRLHLTQQWAEIARPSANAYLLAPARSLDSAGSARYACIPPAICPI